MDLEDVGKGWETWGKKDPMYAILTVPDRLGNKWDEQEFFRSGEEEIGWVLAYIASSGIRMQYHTALDFGCGIGRLTQALAKYFEKVHGVDIASTMIEKARQFNRYGERVQYHVNKTNDLSLFPDNSFDLIYTIITLQHLEPRYIIRYIEDFIRTVRVGGIVIFQVPSRIREDDKLLSSPVESSNVNSEEPFREMFGIAREEIVALLERRHMCIVDIVEDNRAGKEWESYLYFSQKIK
jgi:ubiquinone/menaquinone biosynthesis C-methylase UbiE